MNLSIWFYTMLYGDFVGKDLFGNRYYRGKGKILNNRERRWVIYQGRAEASKVPSEWHAWLHHTVAAPLTEAAVRPRFWQKSHIPNLTGTSLAYRPEGHELEGGKRQQATGDYEAWSPE
jgi:NADH:ubiquinone oxidoreductase subunit